MRRGALLAALAAFGALSVAGARPASADAYLRVISQKAPIRTGPGSSYREIDTVKRGVVLPVLKRGTRGYWFRVELDDGITGWIFGDLVFPFEVVKPENPGLLSRMWNATRHALLSPSPVPNADVELSMSAGALSGEGVFLFRPAYLVDKYFALEGFFGDNPRAQEDVYLAGAGWTLRMLPDASVDPYFNAGAGVAHLLPQADNVTSGEKTLTAVAVGGGLEITLKKEITVRADYRNWVFFDPNQASSSQEFSGGLAIFF